MVGYRTVMISGDVRLSVKNNQMIVDGEKSGVIPIEDISAILIESRRSTITTATLSELSKEGVCCLFCDEKHMPCGVLLPLSVYYRQLRNINLQSQVTLPRKKQLWQQVVTAKISNQANCLALCGKHTAKLQLLSLAKTVASGDPTNIEGTAAAVYFKALFGASFNRASQSGINASLNYGYAIIRGAVARTLASYGFETAVGLHHHSELNPFNLADDLIEPFRPLVDLMTATMGLDDEDTLTPVRKQALLNLLNVDIYSGNENHAVTYAIERLIQSLGRCLTDRKHRLLLPELVELKQHVYE